MSPCVATTRLSMVATITLQPVPQKRQAALSHFNSLASRSVTRFAASVGTGMPAAAAAIAAASSFSIWRRSIWMSVMWILFAELALAGVDGVKDEAGGMDVGDRRDGVHGRTECTCIGRIAHDDQLAPRITPVALAARQREDVGFDRIEAVGARLHHDAGDLAGSRRDDALAG